MMVCKSHPYLFHFSPLNLRSMEKLNKFNNNSLNSFEAFKLAESIWGGALHTCWTKKDRETYLPDDDDVTFVNDDTISKSDMSSQ